jgi:cytochrome P450
LSQLASGRHELSDDEVLSNAYILLFAGHETSAHVSDFFYKKKKTDK